MFLQNASLKYSVALDYLVYELHSCLTWIMKTTVQNFPSNTSSISSPVPFIHLEEIQVIKKVKGEANKFEAYCCVDTHSAILTEASLDPHDVRGVWQLEYPQKH